MSTTDETYLLASQLRFCDHVIKQVKKLKAATPFLVPVDPIKLGIPNYFNIVLNPMDLHTIQSNILHNKYSSPAQFEADFELIIQNCILYNGPGSLITQQALSIKVAFQKLYLSLPTQAAPHFFPPPPKKHRPSIVNRDDRPKRDIIVPTRDPTSPGKKLSPEMRFCNSILKELTHKKHFAFNYVFMAPVDYVALGIPTYPDVIKQPMDLGTIGLKLMKGDYGSCNEFHSDVTLMFSNCYTFNKPTESVFLLGQQLERIFQQKWSEKPSVFPIPAKKGRKSYANSDNDSDTDKDRIAQLQVQIDNLKKQQAQIQDSMIQKRKRRESRKKAKKSKTDDSDAELKLMSIDLFYPLTAEQQATIGPTIEKLDQAHLLQVLDIVRDGASIDSKNEDIELDLNTLDKKTQNRLYRYCLRFNRRRVEVESSESGSDSGSSSADDDDHDHLRKKQVLKEPMKLDLVKVKPEPRSEPKPEPRSEPKQKEESKSTPLHSRTSTPKVSTPPPQKKQKTNVSDLIESAFNKISETKRIDPIEPYALVKPKQQVTTVADILKMNDDLCVRVDFMGDFCLLKKIDESFGGFDGDVFHGVVVDSSKEDYFAKVKKEVEDEMGR